MSEKSKKELAERLVQKRIKTKLFQSLFLSSDGKEVLKELSKMCNENEPTYVDQNPNGSSYKEGQRSIILGIRNIMNKTFEQKQEKAEL